MSGRLFGTDGVRGAANRWPMTPEVALSLAKAAASLFCTDKSRRHTVVIGKDTRLSGYLLEPALTAGFISMGMDVLLLGPLPTPGVARLVRSMRADLGVMLSASHNPFADNGIKFFAPDGYKLSDALEDAIERRAGSDLSDHVAGPRELGRARRIDDALGRYIEMVKTTLPKGMRLDGLKIVVDCAHGAAYKAAPTALWELGAHVIPLNVSPDGFNINDQCGSTYPDAMRRAVLEHGAHLGIALDGDADRVVIADELGHIIDGDQILALIAADWHEKGILQGDGIVSTVMSNLGLERFLQAKGLVLHRAKVGDRYVLEEMRRAGCTIGGEQSGHIIVGGYATTGDGLVASLQILSILVEKGGPLSRLARAFTPVPQKLHNVRCDPALLATPAVTAAIQEAESLLRQKGRLLVRRSGTEPLVRIMAEAEDEQLVDAAIAVVARSLKYTECV
jgi:phosphoglucosamine mutase